MTGDRWGDTAAPWLFGLWLAITQDFWWPFIAIFLFCFALNLAQWVVTMLRQRRAG